MIFIFHIRRPPRSSACRNSWAVSLPLLHSLPNCYPLLSTPCNSRYYPILRWSYGIDSIIGTGLGRLNWSKSGFNGLCILYFTYLLTYHMGILITLKSHEITLKSRFLLLFDVWRPLFQRKPTIFCIPGLFDMLFQNLI